MDKQKKSLASLLVGFITSLKLSIFLFLALALTSAAGTLIQQQRGPSSYKALYGSTVASIIKALDLADMYHAWWFQLLLLLLLTNTLACSLRRLPSALKQIGRDQFLDRSQLAKKKLRQSWSVDEAGTSALEKGLDENLRGVKMQGGDQPDELRWFAQKQRWARLGPYIAHVSLALFFLGGLVGARYGLKGNVTIMEGASINKVRLRSGTTLELPFEVTCTKFELHKYPDGRASDYVSHLEVTRDGKLIQAKKIEVNHPLVQDGIFFYKSTYGGSEGGAVLTVLDREGNTVLQPKTMAVDNLQRIPGTQLSLEVLSMTEAFENYGPAAKLTLVSLEGGEHTHVGDPFLVFERLPDYDKRRNSAHVVQLKGFEAPKRYTGLQVAKDPGVPYIWAASLLLILGTLLSSFASHRRIWISLEKGQVTVAGFATKNKRGFEEDFMKLTSSLRAASGVEGEDADEAADP